MLRRWCLGVTVVITTVTCALPASAQQPPLPGSPPLTVPTVTVPPVTVPPVTVPTTPVTPEVTTPPVQTPTVTTPSVSTSSEPASGAGQASGSGDDQGVSGQASGSGQGGSGPASGTGQSATGQSDTGQASASGGGKSGPRMSSSSSGDDPGNATTRSRDRDLRRAVLSHEACLGQMPRGERRVLTLRAGVGLAHPRSRAQVQRITGLRRARVVALERSGLQRLRSLALAGGCGAAVPAARGGLAPLTGVNGERGIANSASVPRIGVLGERESSASVSATPPPPDGSSDSGRPLLHAPDSAVDLGPILLFVLLAGFVFAIVREARRST